VIFLGFPGGDLAVVNIYVPNHTRDRTVIWEELTQLLPTNCQWILCGDLNMVLTPKDSSNPMGNTIGIPECIAFETLTSHLQVYDFFDYSPPLLYS
jgi:exonuclease III